jgi:hypothetical protein
LVGKVEGHRYVLCDTYLARLRSLFFELGASTMVCTHGRQAGTRSMLNQQCSVCYATTGQCCMSDLQGVAVPHQRLGLLVTRSLRPLLQGKHSTAWGLLLLPTCVFVRLWMVVMQPCTIPSFSWITCSQAARCQRHSDGCPTRGASQASHKSIAETWASQGLARQGSTDVNGSSVSNSGKAAPWRSTAAFEPVLRHHR